MVKVLFAGAVYGNLELLADRVEVLNASKHGPFAGVLCCGDVGDVGNFQTGGTRKFPLPLFFVAGEQKHEDLSPSGNEVAPNIHFLGSCGIKTIDALGGLRVAFVSGTEALGENDTFTGKRKRSTVAYTKEDLNILCDIGGSKRNSGEVVNVDVLLSYQAPTGIFSASGIGNSSPPKVDQAQTSLDMQRVCKSLSPRYHFAGSTKFFYQSPPFENGRMEGVALSTRFISLGNVAQDTSDKSRKWLHALSLDALESRLASETGVQCVSSPFQTEYSATRVSTPAASLPAITNEETQRTLQQNAASGPLSAETIAKITEEEDRKATQHFFQVKQASRGGSKPAKRRKKERFTVAPRGDCWYCLASPSCETHLIVSVSDDVYVSLPKGGLSAQHCQIIPISHEKSLSNLNDTVLAQVVKFKQSLEAFFASFGCVALFFERNLSFEKAMQQHAYLEVIPIPETSLPSVLALMESQAERMKISFSTELGSAGTGDSPGSNGKEEKEDGLARLKASYQDSCEDDIGEYFYIEVSKGGITPRMFKVPESISQDERLRLPLHFGRTVACVIMNCMNRINWKGCLVPQAMEERMASDFKDGYKPFEPSWDE